MKKLLNIRFLIQSMAAAVCLLGFVSATQAHPYASAITNIVLGGSNYVQFVMNEGGANVYVVFDDGSSNVISASLPAGQTNFSLGAHTGFQIIAAKLGTGTPVQISSDAGPWVVEPNFNGVDVNKNPTNGDSFGRVYFSIASQSTNRQWGIYGLTPDLTNNSFFGGSSTNAICANTSTTGPFGNDVATGNAGFGQGPYRLTVAADGTVWVGDTTDGNANLYQFGRNFEFTNQVWTVTGQAAGSGANQHGNVMNSATKGSQAGGDLQIFTADNSLAIPGYFNDTNQGVLGNGGLGNFGGAQETVPGDQNVIYRYDIGSGTFPCTNTPKFAVTLGLNGASFGGQFMDVALGTDTNLVYATFVRANYSDANLQVFRQDTGARVYSSLAGTPTAPSDFYGSGGILPPPPGGSVSGARGGVRISPDGRFIAVMARNNQIVIANLTNGIPDDSSVYVIINAPGSTAGGGRELAWDAADNIFTINTGTATMREYSLGISTTCISSNDITGNHGSFQLVLPAATVTVVKAGDASQNYGTPIAGLFTFNLTTSTLAVPVAVNFTLSGTATNRVNYNIVAGTSSNGVTITTNAGGGTITFPAGTFPGTGNWTANVTVVPTTSPAIGATLTVGLRLAAGTTYFANAPLFATVNILNTGTQFFFVSASPTATTMSRNITNDYAKFIINRWGDLNGPSNSAGNVTPKSITLTTFTLGGTAVFLTDYTAGVQKFTGSAPVDGSASVTFNPGDSSLVVMVGNPVSHANVLAPATNVTVIPSLLTAGTTNGLSQEGYAYTVNNSTVSLTEFDNKVGTLAEVVLWSDPLTNSTTTSYTVTFASTNLASTNVLPVYLPNYTYTNGGAPNGSAANFAGNSNTFDVMLGFPLANENAFENSIGVFATAYANPPASPVMTANGWTNVLRMTVNKQVGSQPTICAVNVFPTTNNFVGNYALRFDMYLSIWSGALNNPGAAAYARQFAAFGINTQGTNCDWRMQFATGIPAGTGSGPTNADGIWYAIDAADQSLTPADFDAFTSPALPNFGTTDNLSATALTEAGVFKRPPFPVTDGSAAGTPINQWVNVSVETKGGTNVSLLIDQSVIFQNMSFTNIQGGAPSSGLPAGLWTNGVPMLGYLQPYAFQSDESAFVYYSNVRVVELSPYVTNQTSSYFVFAGETTNLTFTSGATYASPGLTNKWMSSTTATPTTVMATTNTAGTNFFSTFSVSNVTVGSNYWAVWSDAAGSVTSYVATVEVVNPVANQVVKAGAKATFTVPVTGSDVPTFQWQTNGVNLVNGNKYTNVTTVSLGVSNCQPADAAVSYDCVMVDTLTNLVGLYLNTTQQTLTSSVAALVIAVAPSGATVTPASQTNLWGSTATFNVSASGTAPFTYAWKKNGVNMTNAGVASGVTTSNLTLTKVTRNETASYTASVTNVAGTNLSGAGVLTVIVPAPTFSTVVNNGANVVLSFGSTNAFDNTNGFILQSTPDLTLSFTNSAATFTTNAGGFQVTVPQNGSNMFYRLLHAN